MNFKIDKKTLYVAYSGIVGVFILLFSYGQPDYRAFFAFAAVLVSVLGVFLIQYPTIKISNVFAHTILPFHLTIGVILTLIYFPNLSLLIRLMFLTFFVVSMYMISLVNNVFLVVEERSESIPLFRAAITWAQILVVVISIPFLAGVFKLPINNFLQNAISGISALLYTFYLFWVFELDPEFKKPTTLERGVLYGISVFTVTALGLAVSFIPTESFLRALFVASVMMFNVALIFGHLRNSINRNLIVQHFIISLIFFVILIVFTP